MTSGTERDEFPLAGLLVAVLAGLPLLAIAMMAALFAAGIDGRPDDVIFEFGGHVVGGTVDRAISVASAVVLGTGGIFLLVKFWHQFTTWRDRSSP